jgi:putative endonuclease
MNSSKEIGTLGENIAKEFLMKQGFSFVESNFLSYHHGEIDLVFKRDSKYHFIEVKSIQVSSLMKESKSHIDPRDNMTLAKYHRLLKTVEYYCIANKVGEGSWQLDLACVYIDMTTRSAKVELVPNIIL